MEDTQLASDDRDGNRNICNDPERRLENRRYTCDTGDHSSGRIIVFVVSVWISGSRRYQAVCSIGCIYRNGGLADRPVFVCVWRSVVFVLYGEECMDTMDQESKTKTVQEKQDPFFHGDITGMPVVLSMELGDENRERREALECGR